MEEEAKGRKNRLDSSAADSLPPPSFLGLLCRVSAHPWASKLLPPSLTPLLSLSLSLSSSVYAASPNSQTAIITTCLKSYEFPNVCQEEQEGVATDHRLNGEGEIQGTP